MDSAERIDNEEKIGVDKVEAAPIQTQDIDKKPQEIKNLISTVEREYVNLIKTQKDDIQRREFNPKLMKQLKEYQRQGLVSGLIHPKEYFNLSQTLGDEFQKEDDSAEIRVVNTYQTYFADEIAKLRKLLVEYPSVHVPPASEEFKDILDKYVNWETKDLSTYEDKAKWLVSFIKMMNIKTSQPVSGALLTSLCNMLKRVENIDYYQGLQTKTTGITEMTADKALSEYLTYKDLFTHLENSEQFQNLKKDPRMTEVLMRIAHKRRSAEELLEAVLLLDCDQNEVSHEPGKEVTTDLMFLLEGQINNLEALCTSNMQPVKIDTPKCPSDPGFDACKSEHRENEPLSDTLRKWIRNYLLSNIKN